MGHLNLNALDKALASLEQAVAVANDETLMTGLPKAARETIVAGAIQNFAVTYELCWKFIKRWLAHNLGPTQVEGVTRRHLFRLAAEQRLLDDVEQWMEFHQARNRTSHVYDQDVAREVFAVAIELIPPAQSLLERIRERND